ncbi:MAG: hypothetical protein ACYC66_12090 [Chloroflexota bacterium]
MILHVDQLREFLGLPAEDLGATYQALLPALERVLQAVERAVLRLPSERLGDPTPNRGRDLRELAFNIHDPVRAMAVSLDTGLFQWDTDRDFERSRALGSSEQLARFCREVRVGWVERARRVTAEEAERLVETPRGAVTQLQLLESQAWHAAQHLRQVYLFLKQIGIIPDRELTAEEMAPIHLGDVLY